MTGDTFVLYALTGGRFLLAPSRDIQRPTMHRTASTALIICFKMSVFSCKKPQPYKQKFANCTGHQSSERLVKATIAPYQISDLVGFGEAKFVVLTSCQVMLMLLA